MLCFVAAYLDKGKELQMSRITVETENKHLALGKILHTMVSQGRVPLSILLLKGSGFAEEEYDRMVAECDYPPNEIVYLCPELVASASVAINREALMAELKNKLLLGP